MLYYDRNDFSEGVYPTKSNRSKECMIWRYWFFNRRFKCQDSVCRGCHDLTILYLIISDIAIIPVENVDSRFIIHNINNSEAIKFIQKSSSWRPWAYIKSIALVFSLLKAFFYFFCFAIYKMIDSEYNIDINKSVKISTGAVIRNPKILEFVLIILKLKKPVKTCS